jgi:chaperonin GroEL
MAAKFVRSGGIAGTPFARGVDVVADLVCTTMGPPGRAVLVGRSHAPSLLLRDGYAVAQQLELAGAEQQMGVQAMRELAWRTSDQVGDGTSTSIVMARALMHAGATAMVAGVPPAVLKDAIDAHCRRVVAELEAMSVPVTRPAQLVRVATQAAGGDAAIGALIADAHERIGIDGVLQVEQGHGVGDEVRVDPGLHFDQGWISSYFAEDQQTQSVEIDDPLIVLHLGPITELGPIVPVLEMIAKADRGLVIIAENVGGEALSALVVNKQRAGFKVAAVKAPGTGFWRQIMLDDIAVATGGMVIAESLGTRLGQIRPHMIGRAQKVRITPNGTTIHGGRGRPAAVAVRVGEIREAILREKHLSFDRDQHRRRLAWLTAGIATVRLGGFTATEIGERQARATAASAAVRAARAGGVLAGGSSALVHAARRAAAMLPGDMMGRLIARMFAAAMHAPLRAIARNAGADAQAVVAQVEAGAEAVCYEAVSRRLVASTSLYDALPVARAALINSVSTASRLLNTGAAISSRAA